MPTIKDVSIVSFRSHEAKSITLHPGTTIITGRNGAGKTSLLEAIYIGLRGSSFKGPDLSILQTNKPWWRIDMTFDDNSVRSVTFDSERTLSRKQFTVNGRKTARLSPKDKYPVIIFEPTDLQLLHGSPTRRRDFIDRMISQTNPLYSTNLNKYDRALRQRNALLKKEFVTQDALFPWNIALSEYGSYIIRQRQEVIEKINEIISEKYRTIAKNNDTITVKYSYDSKNVTPQSILKDLESSNDRDRALKYTSVGPHRHDIIFEFNNTPALLVASRGEVRSIVIALKYIEKDIITDTLNIEPIVLLDDVFSELDIQRQEQLTIGEGQHIITSTQLAFDAKDATLITLP